VWQSVTASPAHFARNPLICFEMTPAQREAQAGTPILVSHLVLLDTERVLRSRYELSKADICGVFSDLIRG